MLLSAVAVAGFPLFIFMWMYLLCTTPRLIYLALLGQNLPVVSGQTIGLAGVGEQVTTSTFGYAWGKQGD